MSKTQKSSKKSKKNEKIISPKINFKPIIKFKKIFSQSKKCQKGNLKSGHFFKIKQLKIEKKQEKIKKSSKMNLRPIINIKKYLLIIFTVKQYQKNKTKLKNKT